MNGAGYSVPGTVPGLEFVLEARVTLAPTLDVGLGPFGQRRLVPITGGTFAGPALRGRVLAGGADRQWVCADGVRRLEALYELETDDGAVLTVNNRVLVDEPEGQPRYAFSHVSIIAPAGPHGWLNRVVLVGSLHRLRPELAVLVRVYALR